MALSFKDKFINAMFGTPVQGLQPESSVQYQYPTQRQTDFMNNFRNNEDLIKAIQASPYYQGYSNDELFNRVAQGQNFGLKDLADEQKEWGIKLPRAGNDYDEEALRNNSLNVYQPTLRTGVANDPRKGGIINDFMTGARENYNQGFSPDDIGQKKNFATRLGEGVGTLARFYDKPIGRALMAYGLSRMTGEMNPINQGIEAFIGRQGNITRDTAYRQALQQMGVEPEQINSIPYIVTDDVYKNLANAKNIQEQQAYRQMVFDETREQNKRTEEYRQKQLENQEAQRQFENDFKLQQFIYSKQRDIMQDKFRAMGLSLQQAQLAADNWYKQQMLGIKQQEIELKNQPKSSIDVNKLTAIGTQLQKFDNIFEQVNNPYRYRVAGGASRKLNTLAPQESNFEAQATLLFNNIARDLGGEKGVLSDQDIQRVKDGMPTLKDTLQQKRAKMSAIYSLLETRLAQAGIPFNNPYDIYGNKVLDTQTSNKPKKIGNYTVEIE